MFGFFIQPTLVYAQQKAKQEKDVQEKSDNKVSLLRNNEYYKSLYKQIRLAKKSIYMSYYIFRVYNNSDTEKILKALITAKKRGVAIVIFLDKSEFYKNITKSNQRAYNLLKDAGIRVFWDDPKITLHAKIALIDAQLVYIGSHNLTQSAFNKNKELSVLISSKELAAEVLKYLQELQQQAEKQK